MKRAGEYFLATAVEVKWLLLTSIRIALRVKVKRKRSHFRVSQTPDDKPQLCYWGDRKTASLFDPRIPGLERGCAKASQLKNILSTHHVSGTMPGAVFTELNKAGTIPLSGASCLKGEGEPYTETCIQFITSGHVQYRGRA